jgi:hypothetical protein
MSPPIYKQASKQACGLIMSWVAHQNEHESSMMGLQAAKWLFVAVTTTTITKLFRGWGGVGNSVSNKHVKGGTHQLCIIIWKSSSHPHKKMKKKKKHYYYNTNNT